MAEAAGDNTPGTSSLHHKFKVIPSVANDDNYPKARSGHRTFADSDFIYVVGGFTDSPTETILRELWKFNLASHKWTKCTVPANFPTTLASFACQSTGPGSFMVYGGTAIPFGQLLDETVYMGKVEGDKVKIETVMPTGNKQGCYGHVLVYDPVRNKTFSVGGTDGTNFKLDVHALGRDEATGEWAWEEYAILVDEGLYRMEAVLEKDMIFIFGGGTTARIVKFENITVFNIARREYEHVQTEPDPVHGYPTGRRCHSLVRWGRQVVIAGGCFDESRVTGVRSPLQVLPCVWSFNLDTFTWRRMADLPIPVFFHDASVTPEGEMFLFGGVAGTTPRARTASLQSLWLAPPTLFSSALSKIGNKVTLAGSGHVLSDRLSIARHVFSEAVLPA